MAQVAGQLDALALGGAKRFLMGVDGDEFIAHLRAVLCVVDGHKLLVSPRGLELLGSSDYGVRGFGDDSGLDGRRKGLFVFRLLLPSIFVDTISIHEDKLEYDSVVFWLCLLCDEV